jgi:hypothetical protein
VPPLDEDRYMAADLETATELVRTGALVDAAGRACFPEAP